MSDPTPRWVALCIKKYIEDIENRASRFLPNNMRAEIDDEVRDALQRLVKDADCRRVWRGLDKRTKSYTDEERQHFINEVVVICGKSILRPDFGQNPTPKQVHAMAENGRKAVDTLMAMNVNILSCFPSSATGSMLDMLFSQVNADFMNIPKGNFYSDLIRAILVNLKADIDRWEIRGTELDRPNHPTASRVFFVRQLTDLFLSYFQKPLREAVAIFSTAAFPQFGSISAAAVAQIAPCGKNDEVAR